MIPGVSGYESLFDFIFTEEEPMEGVGGAALVEDLRFFMEGERRCAARSAISCPLSNEVPMEMFAFEDNIKSPLLPLLSIISHFSFV